MGKKVW